MNDLESGVRIGSYELLDLIGQTGMSEVWRAQDRRGQMVALKTISSQAGDDPQLRARFLREGAEHQVLKHPAIVPILDFFEQDGDFYLVMQYIGGGSLEDRLEKLEWAPLPIPEALHIARQILPALDYAHQQLVIHRDVKPSNILLDGEKAFLGDFGIALALGRPRITTVSQVMGTRFYMSPEQIQTPLAVTHLTDVYSFGCVLYEMLTGRQPYAQGDQQQAQYAILAKRVHEPPVAPREWNPEIPPRLERIVLTSLAADPLDRFPGCGSFARALEGVELEKRTDSVVVPSMPVSSIVQVLPFVPQIVPPVVPHTVPPTVLVPGSGQRVSVAGNVLAAVFMAVLWIPFAGQGLDTVAAMILLCVLVSNVLLLRLLYKAWAALPPTRARTTPGKAVGYLFIPFYNLYWCWTAFPGFASDFNQFIKDRPQEQPQAEGFYKLFCMLHFYLPLFMLLMPQRELRGWAVIFDFMILIPIMVGVLANVINRLAAIMSQQLASAAEQVQR